MAKLYFRYGTVASAKTMNLLAVAHNYRQQGKRVIIAKPKLDDRFGAGVVASRSGLSVEADLLLDNKPPRLLVYDNEPLISCFLVDEAQFLHPDFIDIFRQTATHNNIPVICYGLRTDFKARLFEGAQRLFELADSIEEIKTTCFRCNRKAIFNARMRDGYRIVNGPQIELGDHTYQPMCAQHYYAGYDTH